VLSYDELIPAIRQALMDFSAGRVVQPLRENSGIRDSYSEYNLQTLNVSQ
jgi:hypothetical protein